MTILENPESQLLNTEKYKFVRGDKGFSFGVEPQTHYRLRLEVHDGEIPHDAGGVGRVGDTVYWWGTSSFFRNSYGVPTTEQREDTIKEAQRRFPGLKHKLG